MLTDWIRRQNWECGDRPGRTAPSRRGCGAGGGSARSVAGRAALLGVLMVVGVGSAGGGEARAGDPVGHRVPTVSGSSLSGVEMTLPDDVSGEPAVLLVAYRRGTQADIDRWTAMIDRELPELRWLEVPTITSPVWRPFAGWIDGGMRRGVPERLWGNVVTLYGDAPRMRDFLGDVGGLTTHVVLLDSTGTVALFWNEGFSPAASEELVRSVHRLRAAEGARGSS